MSAIYKVGDMLKCLRYVRRRDWGAEIRPGQFVKVLQAYSFTMPDGSQLQDITVQRANDGPIAVIHHEGDFELVQPQEESKP